MKTLIALLVLFLATVSLSRAGAAKKTYSGSYKGQPCVVKVTWYNWEGLAPIAGAIHLSSGAVVTFSGSNSQPDVIELTAAGESFRLVRKGVEKAVSWTGSRFSFSEAPAPTPTPSPTPQSVPLSQMVDETYTGSWRGQPFTAQMRWAPGDAPQIVRRGRGTITMSGGQKFSIEGWQPSADAAEFNIKPDASGETYKTTKTTRDGSEAWESTR